MPGLTVLLQDEIARDVPSDLRSDQPHKLIRFSSQEDWKTVLKDVDDLLARNAAQKLTDRIMVFASIDVARYIRRNFDQLSKGVILQDRELRFQSFAGILPQEWLLNRSYILLPFGSLVSRQAQLLGLYGEQVFIRPDSAMKEFSGDVVRIAELESEISARRQIHALHGDQLVVVDAAQDIGSDEYRFWISGGSVVTRAGYNHDGRHAAPCPPEIMAFAERLATHIEPFIDPVVIDFCIDATRTARIMEMNAVSTSGYYPGMDFPALIDAMDQVMG